LHFYRPLLEQQQQQIAEITSELSQLNNAQTARETELQHLSQQHQQVTRQLAALTTAAATAVDSSSELQEQLAECEQQIADEGTAVATATEQLQQQTNAVSPLQQQCAAAAAELTAVQQRAASEEEAYDVCCSATVALQKRTDAVKELLAKRRTTAAAAHSSAASLQAHALNLLDTAETVTRTVYPDWDGRRVTVNGKSPDSVKRSLKAAQSELDAARCECSVSAGEQQAAFDELSAAQAAAEQLHSKLQKCRANVKAMRNSLLQRTRLQRELNK
jgi:chromosome segregation ATPase